LEKKVKVYCHKRLIDHEISYIQALLEEIKKRNKEYFYMETKTALESIPKILNKIIKIEAKQDDF